MRSSRGAGYAIIDEPHPGKLAHLVVDPMWPLFATMMVGSWLSIPWFILNAFALGSPSRKTETLLAIGSVLALVAFLVGFSFGRTALGLGESSYPYARIGLAAVKLVFAYAIWIRQARSVALFTYFGGTTRNGVLVLVAGAFGGSKLGEATGMPVLFGL